MNHSDKTFFEQEIDRIADLHGLPEHYYVQIRHSKAFMEKNFGSNIQLENIASSAAMSRFHFIRAFQQVYGMTPRQFLRDLRIGKAKELLRQGHEVSQVCFDIGYESLPTFSRVFKRGTGHSPRAYQLINLSNRG